MDSREDGRVYGRRLARPLTAKQKILIETLLPKVAFDRDNPPKATRTVLEIGFGGGENLVFQATRNPEKTYIGCEPFVNGVASALKKIDEAKLGNVFIWRDDARLLLEKLEPESLEEIFILFPDPWPKKRHHKRRFIDVANLASIHEKLVVGGILNIATDHADYLEWILNLTNADKFKSGFASLCDGQMSRPSFDFVPLTRFEEKGVKAGRRIYFLKFAKTANA